MNTKILEGVPPYLPSTLLNKYKENRCNLKKAKGLTLILNFIVDPTQKSLSPIFLGHFITYAPYLGYVVRLSYVRFVSIY